MYFTNLPGVVFHSLFFIVSTILVCGAIGEILPLLIPWIVWTPVALFAMLFQVVMGFTRTTTYGFPIITFYVMVALLMFYASAIVASYFRLLYEFKVLLAEILGVQSPRYNIYTRWCPRMYGMSRGRPATYRGGPSNVLPSYSPPTVSSPETSSATPLDQNVMKDRLGQAYAKLKKASQQDPAVEIEKSVETPPLPIKAFLPVATQTEPSKQMERPRISIPSPKPDVERYLVPKWSPRGGSFQKRRTLPATIKESFEMDDSSSDPSTKPEESRRRALSAPDAPRLVLYEEKPEESKDIRKSPPNKRRDSKP